MRWRVSVPDQLPSHVTSERSNEENIDSCLILKMLMLIHHYYSLSAVDVDDRQTDLYCCCCRYVAQQWYNVVGPC